MEKVYYEYYGQVVAPLAYLKKVTVFLPDMDALEKIPNQKLLGLSGADLAKVCIFHLSPFPPIVANKKHASTYSPVAFRSVHTGIEPPFLIQIFYSITACMTWGFTSRKF